MTSKSKPKQRCKNCGDETRFPSNADIGREKAGWCGPCWSQAGNEVALSKPRPDGTTVVWEDDRTISGKLPSTRPTLGEWSKIKAKPKLPAPGKSPKPRGR